MTVLNSDSRPYHVAIYLSSIMDQMAPPLLEIIAFTWAPPYPFSTYSHSSSLRRAMVTAVDPRGATSSASSHQEVPLSSAVTEVMLVSDWFSLHSPAQQKQHPLCSYNRFLCPGNKDYNDICQFQISKLVRLRWANRCAMCSLKEQALETSGIAIICACWLCHVLFYNNKNHLLNCTSRSICVISTVGTLRDNVQHLSLQVTLRGWIMYLQQQNVMRSVQPFPLIST